MALFLSSFFCLLRVDEFLNSHHPKWIKNKRIIQQHEITHGEKLRKIRSFSTEIIDSWWEMLKIIFSEGITFALAIIIFF
jgi:hypothetical protein